MPRSSPAALAELTMFARTIRDWMWAQRPPLNVARFAAFIGVPNTTVWGWFREGRLPNPITLDRISACTGLPLDDLYEVCGYPLPQSRFEPVSHDPYQDMLARMMRDPRLSPIAKLALVENILRVKNNETSRDAERWISAEHGLEAPQPAPEPATPWEGRIRAALKDEQATPEAKLDKIADALTMDSEARAKARLAESMRARGESPQQSTSSESQTEDSSGTVPASR